MQVLEPLLLIPLMLVARSTLLRFIKWKVPKSDRLFFLLKCLIVCVGMMIFPDKAAVKELSKAGSQGFGNTFIIYYILGLPLTELGISGRGSIVFINHIIMYSLSLYLYNLCLSHDKKSREGQMLYLLILFYPDLVYFGFFSLRDLGIAAFSGFIILSLLCKRIMPFIFWSLLLFLTRPEMIVWLFIVLLFYAAYRIKLNLAALIMFGVSMAAIFLSLPYAFFAFLKFNNWFIEVSSVMDALNFLMEVRYERQFSDSDGSGGTSPTLSRDLFYAAPIGVKVLLQTASLFYISLAPSSNVLFMAILTGIYPLYVWFRFLFVKAKYTVFIVVVSISSYVMYGPFLVNGGNAFRLRTTFIVLVFVMLAIPFLLKNRKHRSKI